MLNIRRGWRARARKALPQHLWSAVEAARGDDTLLVDWVNRGLVVDNWGDAIAPLLVEKLSGKHVVNQRDVLNLAGKPVYTTIGSMLGGVTARNLVVWGTGFVSSGQTMQVEPHRICAVRGPLTRQRLLDTGVACPEQYGDPALLYPHFYRPTRDGRYRLGVIPHIRDLDLPVAHRLAREDGVTVIDIRSGITEVADQINQCERIASASLHGLVAAAAYGVPAWWVQFSDRAAGDGFKFRDYLASIGHPDAAPLAISAATTVDEVIACIPQHRLDLDVDAFLAACPFLDRAAYEANRVG